MDSDGMGRGGGAPKPTKSEAKDCVASQLQEATRGFAYALHTGLRPFN